ncbi:hypothetical protein Cwoe_5430 [Conexibacter woesei DSM 14684]|uniref:Uncharacterized protein n=1 Tax=Conexibacter woesei (strain DSM 14684 / CCUG 47730 / CIP 108061 / JCM 11494 / NBRC 100937 / ID131577) TaxID=469383 RepID=D3EZJ7_CONWI|nr:hypothetical protein Cwoe_5430 [Conexibacter woesei DSM 14684]
MEDTAITIVAALVVTLVAMTYALMIWASAHRS